MAPSKPQSQVLSLLWIVSLAVLIRAVSAGEQATCMLEIQGFGVTQVGVQSCKLHCNTSDGGAVKVAVEWPSTEHSLLDHAGVSLMEPAACQQVLPVSKYFTTRSVFYFCDGTYDLQFTSPIVHDVYWDSYDSLLLFGYGVTPYFIGGSFRHNTLHGVGFVVATLGDIILEDTQFSSNQVDRGAVINSLGGNVVLINTTIDSNIGACVNGTISNITMVNCTMRKNIASKVDEGDLHPLGAVVAFEGSVDISNTTIEYNLGASVNGFGTSIMLINCTVSNNVAGKGDLDGAIFALGGTVGIADSTFRNNIGAALKASAFANVTMVNCTVRENRAMGKGGDAAPDGIEAGGHQGVGVLHLGIVNLKVYNTTIENNIGSALRVLSSNITVMNSIVRNNVALRGSSGQFNSNYQGATAGQAAADATALNNVDMSNGINTFVFVVQGGAAAAIGSSADALSNIDASDGLGTFNMINSKAEIINSSFSNNSASIGGACWVVASDVQVYYSTFTNNSAAFNYTDPALSVLFMGMGGAFCLTNSSITLARSHFVNNSAMAGGVAVVAPGSALHAHHCVFTGNSAWSPGTSFGDALCYGGVFASFGSVTMSSCMAQMNTALHGGVVGGAGKFVIRGSQLANNHAEGDGGCASILAPASLEVINSTLIGNTAGALPNVAVALRNAPETMLASASNSASNQVAYGRGGALCASGFGAALNIVDSVVSNNSAGVGGGVFVTAQGSVRVQGSNISNNIAGNYGGIGAAIGTLEIVASSSVVGNEAYGYGGGVGLVGAHYDLQQVVKAVHNNTAKYDHDVAVPASNISVLAKSPNQPGQVSSLMADGLVHYILNVTGEHNLPCEGVSIVAGVDSFVDPSWHSQIPTRSQAGGMVDLNLQLPLGQHNVSVAAGDSANQWFLVELASCNLGQVADTKGICQPCPAGSYSLSPNASCSSCPEGAGCPGGAVIVPGPNYWRSSPLSDQIHRCPNPLACVPANATTLKTCASYTLLQASPLTEAQTSNATCTNKPYGNLQCSSGYQGNLCGMCSAGYGSPKAFSCQKCMSRNEMIGLYVLAAFLLLGFIKVLCHFTLAETGARAHGPLHEVDQGLRVTDLLKPLVVYLQYLLIITTLNVEWPSTFSYPCKVLAWMFSAASPHTLSVDCLSSPSSLPFAVKRTMFYVIAPLVMLVALLVIEAVLHMLWGRKKASAASVIDVLASSTIVVLFFFLPSLARTTFGLFACVQIDTLGASSSDAGLAAVGKFWLLDLSQACFSGYHHNWALGMGLPLLVFICLALPSIAFILTLFGLKNTTDREGFARHYGFLFRTYKAHRAFWEGVIILETIALVAVSVFGHSLGSYFQVVIAAITLTIVYGVLVIFKPYAQDTAQHVMEYGLLCLLLTALVALTLMPDGYVQEGKTDSMYKLILGVILAVMNFVFVAYVAYRLFKLVSWSTVFGKVQQAASKALAMVGVGASRPRAGHVHAQSAITGAPLTLRDDVDKNVELQEVGAVA